MYSQVNNGLLAAPQDRRSFSYLFPIYLRKEIRKLRYINQENREGMRIHDPGENTAAKVLTPRAS